MPKFAIIDDEDASRSNLRSLLEEHYRDAHIIGEADGVKSGLAMLQNLTNLDAVFLDIQMQDGTGFDLLAQLKEPEFEIIFATAYDRFAVKAFEYNAIDYLLKPVDLEQLQRAVARVEKRVNAAQKPDQNLEHLARSVDQNDFSQMVINTTEGRHFVVLDQIRYLKADKNYSTFFMQDGSEITSAKTLGKYAELLPAEEFIRVHQSYLVRLDLIQPFIKNKATTITLQDGEQIPISRRKKDLLAERLKTSKRFGSFRKKN